jgi:alpha-1,2-glucosyltransferase
MGSTLFVLMGYKLSRDKRFNLSALFLGLAMLFRQTNVIWVVFVAAVAAVELLQIFKKITPNTGFDLVYYAVLHLGFLMSWLYSYFGLVVAFIVFVKMNGSIVLGDKSNHEASIHVPQMFYFILFTFGFAFFGLDPFALVKPTYYKIRNNIKPSFFGLGLMFYCVHKYT